MDEHQRMDQCEHDMKFVRRGYTYCTKCGYNYRVCYKCQEKRKDGDGQKWLKGSEYGNVWCPTCGEQYRVDDTGNMHQMSRYRILDEKSKATPDPKLVKGVQEMIEKFKDISLDYDNGVPPTRSE